MAAKLRVETERGWRAEGCVQASTGLRPQQRRGLEGPQGSGDLTQEEKGERLALTDHYLTPVPLRAPLSTGPHNWVLWEVPGRRGFEVAKGRQPLHVSQADFFPHRPCGELYDPPRR